MVPASSIAAMAVTLLICLALPLGGLIALNRGRRPGVGRAFACGMLAFFLSQVVTRLPLMALVVPQLPQPVSGFLLAPQVASFTAGLFEETGRLIVMLWLLKRFHRLADGLAFGLGHGGLEAILLVALMFVNNLVVAVMMNTGQWAQFARALPADRASAVETALTKTPWSDFLSAGIERIGAVALHTVCSLIILTGIVGGRKLLAWLVTFCAHGCANLAMISAVQAKLPTMAIELGFLALIAVLLWWTIRTVRPALPTDVPPAPTALAAAVPPGPTGAVPQA